MPTPRFDSPEIHRAIDLLLQPNQVYELRVLDSCWATVRGYYTDYERLAWAAGYMNSRAPAVYLTLNPVARDLLARSANRLVKYARETTSDFDILVRRWLPIDFDAVRPAGISSTQEGHQQALDRAIEARDWLDRCGWPMPILAESGNGAHLLCRVDLPNDADATNLLRDCLQAFSFRYDDNAVKVDTGNYNASRIWKLYGTLVCKGGSISDRPHILARMLEAPEPVQVVPVPLLQSLAAQVLARCPWNGHEDYAGYIVSSPGEAIAAGCHHNSCQVKGWAEFREAVEPEYRQRKQKPRTQQQRAGGRHSRSCPPKIHVPGGSSAAR